MSSLFGKGRGLVWARKGSWIGRDMMIGPLILIWWSNMGLQKGGVVSILHLCLIN